MHAKQSCNCRAAPAFRRTLSAGAGSASGSEDEPLALLVAANAPRPGTRAD